MTGGIHSFYLLALWMLAWIMVLTYSYLPFFYSSSISSIRPPLAQLLNLTGCCLYICLIFEGGSLPLKRWRSRKRFHVINFWFYQFMVIIGRINSLLNFYVQEFQSSKSVDFLPQTREKNRSKRESFRGRKRFTDDRKNFLTNSLFEIFYKEFEK